MPTLVFSALDAINHVFTPGADGVVGIGGDTPSTSPLNIFLVQTGIGSWDMNLNLSAASVAAPSAPAANCFVNSAVDPALIQIWEINYNRTILPVPDNALVKKLTFRRPRSVNLTLTTGADTENQAGFAFTTDGVTPIYFTLIGVDGFISPFNSPMQIIESFAGAAADEILFDHTGTDTFVTKDDLIVLWSSFNNSFNNLVVSVDHHLFDGPCSSALSGSIVFGLGWTITVEYDDAPLQWTIPQNAADDQYTEGSEITLISQTVELPEIALDFELVTQVDILIPDPLNPGTFITINVPQLSWTLITPRLFRFIMPSWAGNLPTVIKVVLTSTQFSGTVERQLYTINFVSASGIYELVSGKTSDTLYIEAEPGETIDVKIPNPFGRTGFFGK